MRAALLVEPGRIEVAEVDAPEPGPADVRVAVHGVGLCGSDMSVFRGRWEAPRYPWIMGHESFGTIEAVGGDVPAARLGQLVVIEPNMPCLACAECARGLTSACPGRRSIGMNRPGALAELVVLPAHLAWPIERRDPRDLVCVEPLAVVEAALRRLPAPLPEEVLVVGAGAQGLLMCLALLRRGIRPLVIDVSPERVAFATGIGAAALDDGERTFELVVDTTGIPDAMAQAVRHTAVGATILELGLEQGPLGLSAATIVRRQLVLRGSLTYDHPGDFRAAVSLVDAGAVSPGRVVSDAYPLAEAQRAFESSATARGKTWITVTPLP